MKSFRLKAIYGILFRLRPVLSLKTRLQLTWFIIKGGINGN